MNSLSTDLVGKSIEMKARGDTSNSWTDERDSDRGDLAGVVRTVAVGQDGVVILQIEDSDGWIHTRSTISHIFRVSQQEESRRDWGKPYFRNASTNDIFKFKNPPTGYSTGKLIKLEKAPGWAMPEGWDFVLADDPDVQDFEIEFITAPAPDMPKAPEIPEE